MIEHSTIAQAIFKNLSLEDLRRVKGVSHAFYEQATQYLIDGLANKNLHLNRVIPPSDAIKRQQTIEFNAKSLQELFSCLFNEEKGISDNTSGNTSDNWNKFNKVMEKIRLAVQSNLGLSRVQREAHETSHPIYIKLGAPIFPMSKVGEAGELDQDSIIYQTEPGNMDDKRQGPQVVLLKDNSEEGGLSICFDTKFRKYLLHIDDKGQVTSQLTLKWEAIYEDLLPHSNIPQPLRAFTPWQRHAEANFFNGRSTNKVLDLLTKSYPDIFNYDSSSYFKEEPIFSIKLDKNTAKVPPTDKKNIYLILDKSFFNEPEGFEIDLKQQPIFAVIKTNSSLRGDCFSLVPAIYEEKKLHILIKGHQEQTEVVDVFHANFKTAALQSWPLLQDIKISGKSKTYQPNLIDLTILSDEQPKLMSHITTAPMVRGSGPGARQYWLNEFFKATVYSEMIVIAEVFNRRFASTPLDSLEQTLNHVDATKSFYRLQFSRQELEKTKAFVFQLAIPNEFSKPEDFEFFYGEKGNKLEETTKLAIHLLKRMVPKAFHNKIRIGINMCCPAASVENIGAGFGLRHRPDFIKRIVKAAKDIDSSLKVEFKTLMLSHEDSYSKESDIKSSHPKSISKVQNERFTRVVSETKANRLVYQAKSRNIEAYDLDAVSHIMKEAKTPKEFQFGFSGMVSTITTNDLYKLGYSAVGEPHHSIQSILEKVNSQLEEIPAEFEIMLGRVLLGSAWALQGRYASDAEILLHTLLHAALEQEWAEGMGRYGMDLYQIQVLYDIRYITHDENRNQLIDKILNAQSMQDVIDEVMEQYISLKKKGQCNSLQLHKLEQAVFSALPNNNILHQYKLIKEPKSTLNTGFNFFSSKENSKQALEENQALEEGFATRHST